MISGNFHLDWEGLGDRRRANASQHLVEVQPFEQSQAPRMMDLQDLLEPDTHMRQSDYTDHLEPGAQSSSALHPYYQSSQQQAHLQKGYLSYEPASQTFFGSSDLSGSYDPHSSTTVAPSDPWADYTVRTEELALETSVMPIELAQSEGLSHNDNLSLSSQHQTDKSRQQKVPGGQHLAQFFETSQPTVLDDGYGSVVYQGQVLAGFGEQRIIYMQAQLASFVPYREVFADQHPLRWAMLVHALGHASPPRQDVGFLNGSITRFWLPSQAEYSHWDVDDAKMLQSTCLENEIKVDWGLLDQIGTQAQLEPGPPPSVAPYGTQQAFDPQSQPSQPPALSRLLLQAEDQAHQSYPTEDVRELSSSWGEDRTEPVNNPVKPLEEPTFLESGGLDDLVLYNSLLGHVSSTPVPLSSQPSAAAPQLAGNIAIAATEPAHPQQPQQTTATQTSQEWKPPRKQKELKRLQYDSNAMLRPRSNVSAVIRLATEADRAACTADISWYKPKNPVEVCKVPGTDQELEPHVVYMLESMMDTSKADDKRDKKSSFHKRWSDEAIAKKWPVSLEAMEAICWIIVKMARRYHHDGPAFLNLFDKLHQDKANKNQDLTFVQRINAICTVFLVSKARVDKCLKHENLGSLVAFPLSVLANCIANRPFNAERKKKLAAGTKWLKKKEEKAKKKAAAQKGAKAPIAAHDQNGPDDAEEDGEVDSDFEEEIDEIEDVNEDVNEDGDEDGDGSNHESDDDGAGNGTDTSQPCATPGEETYSNNGDRSGRTNHSKTNAGASKSPPANRHSYQDHVEGVPTAPLSTEVEPSMHSMIPTAGANEQYADLFALTTHASTAYAPTRTPAAAPSRGRKRPIADSIEPVTSKNLSPTVGKVYRGRLGGLPAANAFTQNGTRVSFHSMDHLAHMNAPSSSLSPAAQHTAAPTRPATSAQKSASKSSRKRSATEHLGLALPSAPKRPRNAAYANSHKVSTYVTPHADTEPVPPLKKRSATEAGLSDPNTREKSARSVDRQIIAPRRRHAPTPSAD